MKIKSANLADNTLPKFNMVSMDYADQVLSKGRDMLVKFYSPAYADITMFGDVAVHLLKLMGNSGTIPGAMLSEDIPEALVRLEAGLAAEKDSDPSDEVDDDAVSLRQRSFPLVEMLKAARKQEKEILWDYE
jgi:hypothetical protein